MPFFKFSGFRILNPQDLGILLVNHKKAGISGGYLEDFWGIYGQTFIYLWHILGINWVYHGDILGNGVTMGISWEFLVDIPDIGHEKIYGMSLSSSAKNKQHFAFLAFLTFIK